MLAPILAPRLAKLAVPYAGLTLAKSYHDGNTNQVVYGLVLAGANSWRTHLVLAQAVVSFVVGQ